MNTKITNRLSHLVMFVLCTNIGFASDSSTNDSKKQPTNAELANQQQTKTMARLKTATKMPFYVPPLRGAPINRVGGGTRSSKNTMSIQALSPEHTGLTINPQPVLYFQQSSTKNTPLEFTIVATNSEEPLIETMFESTGAALQFVDLKKLNVQLTPDVEYQWYIAIVIDPKRRAKDITSGGAIKYVVGTLDLQQTLSKTNQDQKAVVFANAGVWYDALDATQYNPNSKNQLQALLQQIGLTK